MKRFVSSALILFALLPLKGNAGDTLISQLEHEQVDITTRFIGKQVLLFGSMSSPGDVIIKVISPKQDVAISRRVKIGPVWLDSGKVVVKDTPGLMYLLSSKPIAQLLPTREIDRYGLSLKDGLAQGVPMVTGGAVPGWEDAFLRLKREKGSYREVSDAVTVAHDRLFFTHLSLPAKLPIGMYKLDIYQVNHGHVVSQQTSGLDVRQVDLELWVSEIARKHPWLFGLVFTISAMLIGLGLGVLLRRNNDD